jgi:MscS family membrane protein
MIFVTNNGPECLFKVNQLDATVLGNPLSQWLMAAGLVIGAVLLGRLLVGVLNASARKLGSGLVVAVAEEAAAPLTVIATLLGVRLAIESLALPAALGVATTQGTKFFIAVSLTWLLVGVYDAFHRSVFEPQARKPDSSIELHLLMVLRTVAHVLIWLAGLATALNSIGFEVTAVLAGLGIGGMALALASQDTVSNIFGGVIVLTQRPFKVGERIEVNGINGWVQKIGLRTTTVTNWYGRLVQIPNKVFTDGVVTNIDSQGCYYLESRLRIEPWTPPAKVEEALAILHGVIADNELLLKSGWAALDKVEPGYLELEFWYAVSKWSVDEKAHIGNEYEKICQAKTRVNLAVLQRFEQAGIRMALPLRVDMHLDERPALSSAPVAAARPQSPLLQPA